MTAPSCANASTAGRETPVYDTFADDCEEHDPEEHAIEGLDSSVAGPSTVSSIDW